MEQLSIIISICSLVISLTAILWTVYEKIYLKPRSLVTGNISFIKQSEYESDPMVAIRIVNYGPGKIIINSIVEQNIKFLGKLLKKNTYAFVMYDYTNTANLKLPFEIDQYKSMTQFLPIDAEKLFEKPMNRLGFQDSIGRFHFMRKKQLKKLNKEYDDTIIKLKKKGRIFDA